MCIKVRMVFTKNKNEQLERYNVTLDSEVVERVKNEMIYTGGALSPIINNLLLVWIYFKDDAKELILKSRDKWERKK